MSVKTLKIALGTKKAARLGMAGPVIGIAAIFVSMALSLPFNWSEDALSDLGVREAGAIFNTGLIICGLFAFLFTLGVFLNTDIARPVKKIGFMILALGSLCLMGIGIFTMDDATYDIHFFFSVSFFLLVLASYVVLGPSMLKDRDFKPHGILALIFAAIGIAGWVFYWDSGWAIPEALTAFPAAGWIFIMAYTYYKKYNYEIKIIEEKDL